MVWSADWLGLVRDCGFWVRNEPSATRMGDYVMLPSEVSMKGMDVRGGILEPLGLILMSSGNLNWWIPWGILGPLSVDLWSFEFEFEFYDYLGKGWGNGFLRGLILFLSFLSEKLNPLWICSLSELISLSSTSSTSSSWTREELSDASKTPTSSSDASWLANSLRRFLFLFNLFW